MTVKSSTTFDAPISTAISRVETEQSRLSDEKTAFKRFGKKIEDITPDPIIPTDDIIGYEQQTATKTLLRVREAYSETVMNVPHYEEDYDDSYQESITEEFGSELGVLLTQSDQFTPATRSALLSEIDEAIEQRKKFKKVVEREIHSLRSAASEIRSINNPLNNLSKTDFDSATFGALDAYLHQTDVLNANCDEIARNRQHDLADIERSWQSPASSSDLPTYFYQSLPVTYPILAELGKIGDTVEELRQEIERAIIYEVDP